jgi:hypothetical protein
MGLDIFSSGIDWSGWEVVSGGLGKMKRPEYSGRLYVSF